MKIDLPSTISNELFDALTAADCKEIADRIKSDFSRYGRPDSIEVDVMRLGETGMDAIYKVAKSFGERALMMQITSYQKIIKEPFTATVGNLKALTAGFIAFLTKDSIDGWLYHKEADGVFLPWLVRKIKFSPASNHGPSSVSIKLSANVAADSDSNSSSSSLSLSFTADSIAKKTIPELLADANFYHESPELKAEYESDLVVFSKYRQQFGAQFRVSGKAIAAAGYRREFTEVVPGSKMVNDEETITRHLTGHVDATFWENMENGPVFDKQPYHCRLYLFDLALHEHRWVHVSMVTPYVYQPELRDKLILPENHRDLIDILTADMDVIMEDVVEGKSGGTTILCKGAPGLGKTLTAEIYSEVIQKPLYRVHSGQLGTDAASVEEKLEIILKRAARWGAVLLLDEADVFIRRRSNDIQHNAVVASFLRTLEYFQGLFFMTTNRSDDIDDAILSRCIAVIEYTIPSAQGAKQIWQVQSKQFAAELSEDLIDQLVAHFDSITGRDIKELLKLTSKFSRHRSVPYSVDLFRQCAMFRGLT